MKKDEKKLIVSVVGNLLTQYLGILEEHREISEEKFTAKSGYGYACNVDKCSKGITYAERIMDNLPAVLFRNKEWTRKELNSVFHDKEYDAETVTRGWAETSDDDMISKNMIIVLESIGGMRAPEVFSSLIGYSAMRAQKELVDGEKWEKDVESGNFGKIGVNYGKTRDFDVLFGSDKTDLVLSFATPYMLIRRDMVRRLKHTSSQRTPAQKVVDDALRDFTFGVYPRNYGSVVRACEPCAPYQRKFVEFRNDCFKRERVIRMEKDLMDECEELDMIV